MIRATAISLCAFVALQVFAPRLSAQSPGAVRLQLEPGSELTFKGTSTLHGFSCKTTQLQAFIDVDSSYATQDLTTLAHPLVSVKVVIPVKSLACGGELEGNMFKALHADKYPTITYVLGSYDVIKDTTTTDSFAARTIGNLTIAGKTDSIAMRIDAVRESDGEVTATGSHVIRMTEFGIKPPTFMFGALRTGDKITVNFKLKATAQTIKTAEAALGQ